MTACPRKTDVRSALRDLPRGFGNTKRFRVTPEVLTTTHEPSANAAHERPRREHLKGRSGGVLLRSVSGRIIRQVVRHEVRTVVFERAGEVKRVLVVRSLAARLDGGTGRIGYHIQRRAHGFIEQVGGVAPPELSEQVAPHFFDGTLRGDCVDDRRFRQL